DPEFAGGQFVRFQIARTVEYVGTQLALVQVGLEGPAIVIVARVAAYWRQPIWSKRQEACSRDPASHILNVRIEPAVLVDHEDGGVRSRSSRLHRVSTHGAGGAAR